MLSNKENGYFILILNTVKDFGVPPPQKNFAHFPSSPLEFPPRKKMPLLCRVGWGNSKVFYGIYKNI